MSVYYACGGVCVWAENYEEFWTVLCNYHNPYKSLFIDKYFFSLYPTSNIDLIRKKK